jgi:16S rRNA processing protein RimM
MPRSAGNGSRVVVLGRIGGPFGVQGWVRVDSYTDPAENIASHGSLGFGLGGERRAVVEWKRVGRGQLALRLEGVDSVEDARRLTGEQVWIGRDELRELPPGEYYRDDLIGLEAVNREGRALGVVDGFIELPAHPVVVLRGKRERLVPLAGGRLIGVDLAAGRVTFDWHEDD